MDQLDRRCGARAREVLAAVPWIGCRGSSTGARPATFFGIRGRRRVGIGRFGFAFGLRVDLLRPSTAENVESDLLYAVIALDWTPTRQALAWNPRYASGGGGTSVRLVSIIASIEEAGSTPSSKRAEKVDGLHRGTTSEQSGTTAAKASCKADPHLAAWGPRCRIF